MLLGPTVPHTGTHFLGKLFSQQRNYRLLLEHPYPESFSRLAEHARAGIPCVIPRRLRGRVFDSWIKYGKNPDNFAGWSLDTWFAVQGAILELAPRVWILDLDNEGIRGQQLAKLNRDLNLELETDWQPVRERDADQIAARAAGAA